MKFLPHFFALLLFSLPLCVGCGGGDGPTVIEGAEEQTQQEIDDYEAQMNEADGLGE